MTNSRDKGARGERALAALLTSEGFPARRGVQYQGGHDSPDVVCESLPWCHFESKVCERLALYDALEQAKRDAWPTGKSGPVKFPVVAHRRNGEEWVAILRLTDLLQILRESSYVEQPTVADALAAIDGEILSAELTR